jgi:hypothetical protein
MHSNKAQLIQKKNTVKTSTQYKEKESTTTTKRQQDNRTRCTTNNVARKNGEIH